MNMPTHFFNESIVSWLTESRHVGRNLINSNEYFKSEELYLSKHDEVTLYLHFPFCEKLCSYCDLNIAITKDHKLRTEYINSLIEEITHRIPRGKKLKAIYLGGGTPSNLSNLNLEQLFSFINSYFIRNVDIEIIIEAHPNDFSSDHLEKISLLKKYGITEIRLGIEDPKNAILENVNRSHAQVDIKTLVDKLKTNNFIVGGYFLVGLPLQNGERLSTLAKEILEIPLDYFFVRPLRLSNFNTQNMHLFGNGTTMSKDQILNYAFKIHQDIINDQRIKSLGFGLYSRINKPFIRTEIGFMPSSFHSFYGFGVASFSSLNKEMQLQNPIHLNQYLSYSIQTKNLKQQENCKELKAYHLKAEEINKLKKRELFSQNHEIEFISHEINRLESTLNIKLTDVDEPKRLNKLGTFFVEALIKEI